MLFKLVIFMCFVSIIWTGSMFYLTTIQPNDSAALAVKQLNGDGNPTTELRDYEFKKNLLLQGCGVATILLGLGIFGNIVVKGIKKGSS